jgi:hypothetical protein|tara:strand:+ start:370 stop:522 length:153 start_codon:yes stop_codon:yes gene_type:complete
MLFAVITPTPSLGKKMSGERSIQELFSIQVVSINFSFCFFLETVKKEIFG